MRAALSTAGIILFCLAAVVVAADGNRLAYLDENNPWYPHTGFPKLTTPQWVGEEGVEAVVILAIDDMRDPAKYEEYLRPILIRLKQIDGRAPVSIMTNKVDPRDEQLQQWLAEGLSIECHTIDHPCPLLQGGDFEKAASTYHRCVDLMSEIPGSKPVAFRMPCCDSLNTVSPRFFSEIFNRASEKGHYLQIDSSVFTVYTSDDPEIPRELVQEKDGTERFRKYLPRNLKRGNKIFDTFVNTIENYPYPYVINRTCWEFPCMVPSDWEAQHRHGVNNPETVEDWKRALDITVLKQGVFTMVFHPHGWIRNDQIVELIDYAEKTYGGKVKFLTFKEAMERLEKNLLLGHSLRHERGYGKLVPILDVNNDGYMDLVIADGTARTRIWDSSAKAWKTVKHDDPTPYSRFGVLNSTDPPMRLHGYAFSLDREPLQRAPASKKKRIVAQVEWRQFKDGAWRLAGAQVLKFSPRGSRLRDLDGDGSCEMILADSAHRGVYRFDPQRTGPLAPRRGQQKRLRGQWTRMSFSVPDEVVMVVQKGRDAGLRFVDLNEDGKLDIVFSNHQRYGIWLFKDMKSGWSIEVASGRRHQRASRGRKPTGASDEGGAKGRSKNPEADASGSPIESVPDTPSVRGTAGDASRSPFPIPPIVRADGSDNGFFVKDRHLFWQNEDTAELPDLVDRRSFDELLKRVESRRKAD